MGQDQFAKKPGIKNAIYKREIFFFFLQGGGSGWTAKAADRRLVYSPPARLQLGAIRLQRRARISQEEETVGRGVCVRPGGATPHPHAAGQIELAPHSCLEAARSGDSLPAAWCSRPSGTGG